MKYPNETQVYTNRLIYLEEPKIKFGFNQTLENPKDGLLLFGPFEKSLGIEYGVIGTSDGIKFFKEWASKLNTVIAADEDVNNSVMFPGYQAIYRAPWQLKPIVEIEVSEQEIEKKLRIRDSYQRVYDTVSLYHEPLQKHSEEEEKKVSIWFVIIPEDVWRYCRPLSSAFGKMETDEYYLRHNRAKNLHIQPSLFEEVNVAAEKHNYEKSFHNQLKARLLGSEIVTQIIRETTIAPDQFTNNLGKPIRKLQDNASIAWNICTSIYYKSGKKPWSLATLREGVCYIGLVFKRTDSAIDKTEACCGAQLFLDSGDGIVFKGAVGSFASEKYGDFHLDKESAKIVIEKCVHTFIDKQGIEPTELYIHGRTHFNKSEIEGFKEAAPNGTAITGIQIRNTNDLKLFRMNSKRPIMRGHALRIDSKNAYLWTSGYIPQLKTYPGREVPTPLRIRIIFGETNLLQVLEDIMSLTKLNFNSCIFADGSPVTLRFADDVGEILTAIPNASSKPLPFRNYI